MAEECSTFRRLLAGFSHIFDIRSKLEPMLELN